MFAVDGSILNDVFCAREAATLWNKEESTVRKAINNGRLEEGIDYRRSGGVLLVTREAMERLWGKQPKLY